MVSTEVDRYNDVDPADIPSAEWGWSRVNPRYFHIAGFAAVVFLLAMLRGNHVGRVEDIFLVVFAAVVAFVTIRDIVGRKRGTIR